MRQVMAAVCSAALLGGCGTVFTDRSQTPMAPMGGFGTSVGSRATHAPPDYKGGKWQNADIITLDVPGLIHRYATGTEPGAGLSFEKALAAFSSLKDDKAQKIGRNDITGALLMASEKNCEVYLQYIHGNQIAIKGISTAAASILSGAASVTTPERSSKLLAAIAGISTGVGGNLSDAVFSSKAADAIAAGIDAQRAELKAVIVGNMAKPYGEWPLSAAISDAVTYHKRCDTLTGLAYLQAGAETKKAVAEGTQQPAPAKPAKPAAAGN